ncbi:MAG: Maf family protein [Acidobacteriota bacterium]
MNDINRRQLVLGSASPRRREILGRLRVDFFIRAADIDETPHDGERPSAYVRRMAEEKARAVVAMPDAIADDARRKGVGELVLGADTTVALVDDDGTVTIFGKPQDDADAASMLRALQGRAHTVLTGLALVDGPSGATRTAVESTRVHIAPMTDDEIAWYVASGEPRGKAGAYAIQGIAAAFVTHIEGSYSNVVGLPLHAVYRLLEDAGYRVREHTRPLGPVVALPARDS